MKSIRREVSAQSEGGQVGMAHPSWIALHAGMMIAIMLTGCATAAPPSRMSQYVGMPPGPTSEAMAAFSDRKGRTGLVIVDQTVEGAAPVWLDEAQDRFTEQLKEGVAQSLPLMVETLRPAERLHSNGRSQSIARIGTVP
jgi:hypothetical protein